MTAPEKLQDFKVHTVTVGKEQSVIGTFRVIGPVTGRELLRMYQEMGVDKDVTGPQLLAFEKQVLDGEVRIPIYAYGTKVADPTDAKEDLKFPSLDPDKEGKVSLRHYWMVPQPWTPEPDALFIGSAGKLVGNPQ